MINVIIVIAVVLLVVLAVYIQVRNKKNGGSSCGCGGSSSASSGCGGCGSSGGCGVAPAIAAVKKSSGSDTKTLVLDIEGMHCGKCQNSVSEALNSLDGVSATVDLAKNCATVVLSKEVPETALKQAVSDKGFEVTTVKTI